MFSAIIYFIFILFLQTTPPQYYPSNITIPVALYSGTADWLVSPEDVATLVPKIKHLVKHVVIDGWEHLDFMWAMDAPKQCYNDIIQLFKNFTWKCFIRFLKYHRLFSVLRKLQLRDNKLSFKYFANAIWLLSKTIRTRQHILSGVSSENDAYTHKANVLASL